MGLPAGWQLGITEMQPALPCRRQGLGRRPVTAFPLAVSAPQYHILYHILARDVYTRLRRRHYAPTVSPSHAGAYHHGHVGERLA
jgi:hypothetical protein